MKKWKLKHHQTSKSSFSFSLSISLSLLCPPFCCSSIVFQVCYLRLTQLTLSLIWISWVSSRIMIFSFLLFIPSVFTDFVLDKFLVLKWGWLTYSTIPVKIKSRSAYLALHMYWRNIIPEWNFKILPEKYENNFQSWAIF